MRCCARSKPALDCACFLSLYASGSDINSIELVRRLIAVFNAAKLPNPAPNPPVAPNTGFPIPTALPAAPSAPPAPPKPSLLATAPPAEPTASIAVPTPGIPFSILTIPPPLPANSAASDAPYITSCAVPCPVAILVALVATPTTSSITDTASTALSSTCPVIAAACLPTDGFGTGLSGDGVGVDGIESPAPLLGNGFCGVVGGVPGARRGNGFFAGEASTGVLGLGLLAASSLCFCLSSILCLCFLIS